MGFSLFQSWPGSVGCWSPWTDHSIHTLTPTGNLDSPTNRGNWTKPNQTMEEHAEHNPEPFAISYNHISATCQAGLIFTSFLRYRLWFLSNRWSACRNFRFQQTPFKRSSSTSLSCSQGRAPIRKAIKCNSRCDLRSALHDFRLNENKLRGCHYAIYSPP